MCFLFIVNGANLIDGFNGLLSIHVLVIFGILLGINLINGNNDISFVLFFIILSILVFFKFNFPRAQMFLGDSGAYLFGTLVAVSVSSSSSSSSTRCRRSSCSSSTSTASPGG